MSHLTDSVNELMDNAQALLVHNAEAALTERLRAAHKMLVEAKASNPEADWSAAAEQYFARITGFGLCSKGVSLPANLFELEDAGTNAEEEKLLEVLQQTVIYALEGGKKGSKFPALHAYFDMQGDDVEPEKVRRLNEEFLAIKKALGEKGKSLEIGLMRDGRYVRVRNILKKHYASPHASWIMQQTPVLVNSDSADGLALVVDMGLQECGKAIERDCGFGKYSK
jgi:hypothetical protein